MKALHDERSAMFANEIATELDCSYQLFGKRGKMLADRDLVERTTNEQGRRVFKITPTADQTYFDSNTDEFDF